MSKKLVYNHGGCLTLPAKKDDKVVGQVILHEGLNECDSECLELAKADERVKKMFEDKVLEEKGEKKAAPKKEEPKKSAPAAPAKKKEEDK